jgi:hypothetical protein
MKGRTNVKTKKTKRVVKTTKRKTTAAAKPKGLLLPCKLIPLRVFGALLAKRWSDFNDEKVGFKVDDDRNVIRREVYERHTDEEKIGKLPDGWKAAWYHHWDSSAAMDFDGLAADIDAANRACKVTEKADEDVGVLLYGAK